MPTGRPVTPKGALRWYRLTPGWVLFSLFPIEGVLLVSDWLHWIPKGFGVLIAITAVAVIMVLLLLWFIAAVLCRRQFQFSVRSLLLSSVVVAVPCSWFMVEIGRATGQKELAKSLGEHSEYLPHDGEGVGTHHLEGIGYGVYGPGYDNLRGPAFLCRWLGDDFFNDVRYVSVRMITDEDLARLKRLPHLHSLQIRGRKLSDADLDQLRSLTDLEWISLWQEAEITDHGMQNLSGMRQLKALEFRKTKITDEGLRCLRGATQLVSLDIGGARFTDAGLEHLKDFSQLKKLDLGNVELTEAGVDRLKVLPNLQELGLLVVKSADGGLERLKELTQLKKLRLALDDMTDVRLVHV
jgi:hypothetical protein